jgi:hypothetical protein
LIELPSSRIVAACYAAFATVALFLVAPAMPPFQNADEGKRERRKRFFFEKNQKTRTLYNFGRHNPIDKSSLLLFFKKEDLLP